ncbi:MAG: methyltransferase domain-containing protein [Gemmatimonadales bacterium]
MNRLEAAPYGSELLDDRNAAPVLVRQSLRHIARANRWLGGAAAVRYGLRRLFPASGPNPPGPLTLLDVGTGLGDLPRMAAAWAARRGITLRPIGLERHASAAAAARDGGLRAIVGDGALLPFRDASIDLVLLSQVAHHFAPAGVVHLLKECARVARRAVIVADLRRSRAAALGFAVASRLLAFDPHTVRDGITSLRRGFTVRGLETLLAQAGLAARVRRRPGARLVTVAIVGNGEWGMGNGGLVAGLRTHSPLPIPHSPQS